MRIAMISWESMHSIPVGGLAAHVTSLAESLARAGDEVHVFTRMGEGQGRYCVVGGVHYHRCPFDPHADFLTYVGRMGEAMASRVVEAESFYGRNFDVVHGHDWLATPAMNRLRGMTGAPQVLTLHSTEYGRCGNRLFDGPSRAIRDLEWLGAFLATRVICVSRALAEEVRRLYAVPAKKLAVAYNGVDAARFDLDVDVAEVRRACGVERQDPVVLFVGRLTWQKGPDLLLDAAPDVLRHVPSARFLFVGDGDMRSSLEGRARDAGLFRSVRFLGARAGGELVGLFRAADVVCVPSRNEPFGIVVLEAWSARRPVVVTTHGGPREFVQDQVTGWVVDPGRESLGWALGAALLDEPNAARIAANGRAEVEARFTWHTVAEQVGRVYALAMGSTDASVRGAASTADSSG
ncbi:MAG: glycosyltransferase family 4 protein [Phycisphaerae bacterium]